MISNRLTFNCDLLCLNSVTFSHLSYGLTTWSPANQSDKSVECLLSLTFANVIDFHYIKLVLMDFLGPICKYINRLQSYIADPPEQLLYM